jgi:hypothetical protein
LIRRLRDHPLPLFLALQTAIYLWNLNLLFPWFDEADELLFMRSSLKNAIAIPATGGHPPLYFLLTYGWLRLPFGLSWVVQARTLSVLFALAATVAADRLWARRLPGPGRWWFLALWTLSPYLLLYSRMGRSYSLQLLIGTIAAACVWRLIEKGSGFWNTWLALTLALYVHYVPGIALLAVADLGLLRKRRFRLALVFNAAVGVAFLPWLWQLARSIQMWSTAARSYSLTGSSIFEIPLKLAYWAISWTMGEAVPDAVLVAGCAVLVLAGALLVCGMRERGDLVWIALPAALVGFTAVARWVSYPFVPARMIFLYPMALFLFVTGARSRLRIGTVALNATLVLSLSGIWCYFHKTGFRNKQYPLPVDEIAERIRTGSAPETSVILVDSTNSDPPAMKLALGPTRPILETRSRTAPDELAQALADPRVRTVWFLRNTHDVSAGRLDSRFENPLRAQMQATAHNYEPFSPLELRIMRAMGMHDPPAFFHELIEFRR